MIRRGELPSLADQCAARAVTAALALVPPGMVVIQLDAVRQAIGILEGDGDEHGVGQSLRNQVAASPASADAPAPDTFFVIGCPGWPGGMHVHPNTMDRALDVIEKQGNAETTLATWCDQYQRRDYSPGEVRGMIEAREQSRGSVTIAV